MRGVSCSKYRWLQVGADGGRYSKKPAEFVAGLLLRLDLQGLVTI